MTKKSKPTFWSKLGPGIVTGASDDDPSGITTYSQAGAKFGLSLLWTALLTYPLLYAIQEMCARIGIVCSCGLSGVIKKHYSKTMMWVLAILVVPAIIFNIASNISGMGAVINLLVPSISPFLASTMLTIAIILGLSFFKYNTIARILKYFCLILICYFIVPFLVQQDWKKVLVATFLPQIQYSKEYLLILVAILGTTISPYLFFWQASMSREHQKHNHNPNAKEISHMKVDVKTGMFASNLAMYFIILTTASVLYPNGITQINTVKEAAESLKPLAGDLAYELFSFGILGVGMLAVPVLGACIGYIFADILGWPGNLDHNPKETPKFYLIVNGSLLLGLAINLIGLDPIKSLIYTAVVYGLIAPVLIAIILLITNNKKIMGIHTNSVIKNILGVITLLLMTICAVVLVAVGLE